MMNPNRQNNTGKYPRKIILTGEMRVGKSTVCRRIMDDLNITNPCGFHTAPWQSRDQTRSGFALALWDGKPSPFAFHAPGAEDFTSLQVDESVFNTQAYQALEAATDSSWCVIDELGVMEQDAHPFVEAVRKIWAGPQPCLFVIQKRALPFWQELLKQPKPDTLLEITPDNRNTVAENFQ